MKRKILVIFSAFLLFGSMALLLTSPVLAKIPTGECCRLGHSEDCDRLGEGNYICDRAVDPGCEYEGGECFMTGPYGGVEEEWIEAMETEGYNREQHSVGVTEDLLLTIESGIGGMPVEVAQGPDGPIYARKGGAIGMMNKLVTNLYSTPPASSVEYLADVGRNLGLLAQPVYAQGLGWTAFSPVLGLWKKFRNIAYLGFVIIFVVIGFMIMFRAKIDPQTVISIQNALPRIVITLLLVTFSYAIAGFIIDLMELFTRIIGNILVDKDLLGLGNPTETLRDLFSSSVFKLVNPLRNVDDMIGAIRETGIGTELPGPIAWLGSLTVGVIFWIAGFFIMFKIFFALLAPYVSIILSIIFAPFQLCSVITFTWFYP